MLALYAVPRWGFKGLNPLIPSQDLDHADEAVRPLLAALAEKGAVPLLTWRKAADLLFKSKKRNISAAAHRLLGRNGTKETTRYRFVVPTLRNAPERVHPMLSLLCPRSEKQLDFRTHTSIVRLLADRKTSGFYESFVTFDEDDVLSRLTAKAISSMVAFLILTKKSQNPCWHAPIWTL